MPGLTRCSAHPLRVAVVGSGPAGFYAAGALLAADAPVEVDLIERLPTPWGLVRLGVAPDHPNIKAVSRAFEKIAQRPGFRFFGNVEVGRDVTHDELAAAVRRRRLRVGAQTDRRIGIPGEDLPGLVAGDRVRRLVQRPPRLPGPRVRPLARAGGRDRERQRRARRRADARADAGGARADRHDRRRDRRRSRGGHPGDPRRRAPRPGAGGVDAGRGRELASSPVPTSSSTRPTSSSTPASAAELEAGPPTVQRNVDHPPRVRRAGAGGQAARDPAPLLRSPVAILGDEQVEAVELVRNELVDDGGRSRRADRRARDDRVRDRLPQRRLPRRRRFPACRSTSDTRHRSRTTAAGCSTQRASRCRACTAPAGSSAARAASSARTRRTRRRRSSCCSRTRAPGCSPGGATGADSTRCSPSGRRST